jgi:hypothetical protein
MTALPSEVVREAIARVSAGGRFAYTRKNLFYELVRRGAVADPGADLEGALVSFGERLAAFEREHGELAGLVRTAGIAELPPPAELPPDVLDYAVRRVLVFDDLETCLLFVRNGFHRRIEVGLVVHPGASAMPRFPAHVWARLHAQLEAGLSTQFFLVHDCSAAARKWKAAVVAELGGHAQARVHDVGLTFPWAFRLRIPVRSTGRPPDFEIPARHEWRGLLAVGSWAELQELRPLAAMRWVYRRVARGHEDVGFG